MDNKRIIYSTRENIKSTLVIFLKYKKSVLWVNFFVVLLTLLTQFAATYLPGWIVDLLTGENAGTQIWTRVLPVVALIGISELVIEVLNRKKALAYQAVSQKTALDINRVQVGARYRLTEEKEFQDLAYESVRCTQTWGGKRVLTAVVDDLSLIHISGVEGPGGSVKRRSGKRLFDGLLPDFQRLSGRVADYAGSGLDFSGYHGAAGRLWVLCGKRRAEAV